MIPWSWRLLIAVAVVACPLVLQAQQTRRVGAPDFPARTLALAGHWSLTFVRDGDTTRHAVRLDLIPDSVPEAAGTLKLDHVCYACLGSTVDGPRVPWLRLSPTSDHLRLWLATPDTVGAVVGTTMSTVGTGDLELSGRLQGDSLITGTWRQLGTPEQVHGHFELRRLIAALSAAQPVPPGSYRVPSAIFAAYLGCDSANVVTQRRLLLQQTAAPTDSGGVVLATACDALAWLGQPNSYELSTFNGEPSQEVWHFDHDSLPAPILEPPGSGHPWMLTPPLRHRPPRL